MMRNSQNYQDNMTEKYGSQSKWSYIDPVGSIMNTGKKEKDVSKAIAEESTMH
jgi:hypothetical protein